MKIVLVIDQFDDALVVHIHPHLPGAYALGSKRICHGLFRSFFV